MEAVKASEQGQESTPTPSCRHEPTDLDIPRSAAACFTLIERLMVTTIVAGMLLAQRPEAKHAVTQFPRLTQATLKWACLIVPPPLS